MAKAKPLKERRRLWTSKITKWKLTLIEVRNKLCGFCHVPSCKRPHSCPRKCWREECNNQLDIGTALFWDLKSDLEDQVIYPLYYAIDDLKNDNGEISSINLVWAYNGIKAASEGLDRLGDVINRFYRAATRHADDPWSLMVREIKYSNIFSNMAYNLECLARTIKNAAGNQK